MLVSGAFLPVLSSCPVEQKKKWLSRVAKLGRWELECGEERPGFGQCALGTHGTITVEGLWLALRAGEALKFQ